MKLLQICWIIIVLGGTVLTSCKKEDSDYTGVTGQDLAQFVGVSTPSFDIVKKLEDSLSFGVSAGFNAGITYVKGDTGNYPVQLDTIVYQLDYDSGMVSYDGNWNEGKLFIYFLPEASEYDYMVFYDSCSIAHYKCFGSIQFANFEDDPAYNGLYSHRFNIHNFNVWGYGKDMEITTSGFLNEDHGGGGYYWRYSKKKESIGTDQREFMFKTEEDAFWSKACGTVTQGIINLRPISYRWRHLLFGDGDCDNKVKLVNGDDSWNFTIP